MSWVDIRSKIELQINDAESLINVAVEGDDSGFKEFLVTSGMIMAIVSEIEVHFEKSFCELAVRTGNKDFEGFVRKFVAKKFRSPDLSKIKEFCLAFDRRRHNAFWDEVEDTPRKAAWDNLLIARHYIVHRDRQNFNMTLRELKATWPLISETVEAVDAALQ